MRRGSLPEDSPLHDVKGNDSNDKKTTTLTPLRSFAFQRAWSVIFVLTSLANIWLFVVVQFRAPSSSSIFLPASAATTTKEHLLQEFLSSSGSRRKQEQGSLSVGRASNNQHIASKSDENTEDSSIQSVQHGKAPPIESHDESDKKIGHLLESNKLLVKAETGSSFSICLLLKDDNDILPEWLAYHWHTIKLRHLVVAIDPSSTTSPQPVFDRWEQFGLDITTWSDEDFMPEFFLQGNYSQVPRMIKYEDKNASKWNPNAVSGSNLNMEDSKTLEQHLQEDYTHINNHRFRQSRFLTACTKHLQDANLTWMVHIDTDEYVTINPNLRAMRSAGDVMVPTQLAKNSILNLLQALVQTSSKLVNWPCISLPRLFFGSVQDGKYNRSNVPTGFDRSRFETLRWKYHASFENFKLNKLPKVIMDVSGFPHESVSSLEQMPGRVFSIHRPDIKLCRKGTQMNINLGRKYPLLVHHYIGSLERYQARDDPRRNVETYKAKALVKEGRDDDFIESWLPSFVRENGVDVASILMRNYVINSEMNSSILASPIASSQSKQSMKAASLIEIEINANNGLSACLQLKETDSIDQIVEWLAWHYHAMKLRTVIIAVDSSIDGGALREMAKEWKEHVHIALWSDVDFMWNEDMTTITILEDIFTSSATIAGNPEIANPRKLNFVASCLQHFRVHSKSWTAVLQADEFINLHPSLRQQSEWRKLPLQHVAPGSPNFLFEFLQRAILDYSKAMNYPCLSLPQVLYGASADTSLASGRFETVQSKQHLPLKSAATVGITPGILLDLSDDQAQDKTGDAINTIVSTCKSPRAVLIEEKHKFPLTISHYGTSLGDLEMHRPVGTTDESSLLSDKPTDWIDGWVTGFQRTVGPDVAEKLLKQRHSSASVVNSGAGITHKHIFSACSLVKDDNDILDEWVAYHYHTIGLRHIILAVDDTSISRPTTLLNKWRDFGMQIEEWNDHDFMPDFFFDPNSTHWMPRLAKIKKNKERWIGNIADPAVVEEYVRKINRHRFRQINFLSACTDSLRKQKRTWMMHIDTDEYLTINPIARKQGSFGNDIAAPPRARPSVILELLQLFTESHPTEINYPCIALPRLLYGSVEDDSMQDLSGVSKASPIFDVFDKSKFESLRWKYHTDYNDSELNKQPKVIMDVSAIPADDKMLTERKVFSIHRPSQSLCRTQGQLDMEQVDFFPFSVNHYLGTFERFSGRDDLRRNQQIYDGKARVKAGRDDGWMDSWLESFVETQGIEVVSNLLESYTLREQ